MFGIRRDTLILVGGFALLWFVGTGIQKHGSAEAYFSYAFVEILTYGVVVVMSLTLHEYAHAYVAYRAGDHTARLSGRLSLNPLAHLDPLGTLLFLVGPVGWAKPVPVNPENFRDRQIGEVAVSGAGPAVNLALAAVGLVSLRLLLPTLDPMDRTFLFQGLAFPGFSGRLLWKPWLLPAMFLFRAGFVNLNLAVFNLLPVEPLDGSHLLRHLLPPEALRSYEANRGTITLLGVIALFGGMLDPLFRWVSRLALEFVVG